MPDVFLSYKREDLKAATRLVQALRAQGLDVWWDRDIPASAPWEATIETALAEAKVVLVCWSKAAVASENVRSEARWARQQGRLIQIFAEACSPPLFFGERQGIDLAGWSGDPADPNFRDLVSAITARLGESSPEPASTGARHAQPIWRKPKWPLVGVLVAGVVALVVLGAWAARSLLTGFGPPASRIAILPFAASTPSPGAQAFAQGLADQLQGVLNANNMQTITAEDAAALHGPDRDKRIQQLGVKLLFDGDVKDTGDDLEVGIRLEDARQHVTLWTADLSGKSDQPEALEAQAGGRIVSVLSCARRALKPKGGLSDPDALALYLKACDLFVASPGGSTDASDNYRLIESLREAVAKAPGFAPARAALAKYLAWYAPHMPAERQAAMRAEAEQQAHRVLAADKTQPDAYLALERLQPWRDFAAREGFLNQALASDPNSSNANSFMSQILGETGRNKAAIDYVEHGSVFDPFCLCTSSFIELAESGQTTAANAQLDRFTRLYPHLSSLWLFRLGVYRIEGDWEAYDAQLKDRASWPPDFTDKDAAFARLEEKAERTGSPATKAAAREAILGDSSLSLGQQISELARLGFVDDAFRLADSYTRGTLSVFNNPSFLFAPDTASLRRDPRFMGVAAKLGMVAYWRKSGNWPDFCAEPGLPYDCKAEAAKVAGAPNDLQTPSR